MCCKLNHFKTMNNHEKQFQSLKSGFAACSRSSSPFKQWFSHLLVIHWSFIGHLRRYWWINWFQTYENSENFTWPKSQKISQKNSNSENSLISLFSTIIFRDFWSLFRIIHEFWEVLELTSHVLHVLTNLYMIAFEVSV